MQKLEPEKKPDNLRVVLDTNVLISGFLSPRGVPARILLQVAGGTLVACYNQAILEEYEKILSRPGFKFEATPEERRFVLDTLKENGLQFSMPPSVFPMKDESDRAFYDVAKAAGAFLVTGNKKHYPDEPFILTPRELLTPDLNPIV